MVILLEGRDGVICFDAPEGMAREIMRQEVRPVALVLTHGHFDHMWDSVLIQEDHKCPVFVHPADAPMVLDTSYTRMFGVIQPIRSPAQVETLLVPDQGSASFVCAGETFEIFHIPGHSPGSVAFYHPRWGRVDQWRYPFLRRGGPLGISPVARARRSCKGCANISFLYRPRRGSTPATGPPPRWGTSAILIPISISFSGFLVCPRLIAILVNEAGEGTSSFDSERFPGHGFVLHTCARLKRRHSNRA